MAKLFASRLVGLEKHYESIVANLEIIQRCAHNITRHEDYKDLPRSLVAFKTEGNDSTSISADIFCLLSQSYAEYHAYADEYFELAPRNKHIATLAAIRTISQRFYGYGVINGIINDFFGCYTLLHNNSPLQTAFCLIICKGFLKYDKKELSQK